MYCFIVLLLLAYSGFEVNGQFSTLEVTGSGDGLDENSTYSRLPLLDDNGDLSTVVTGTDATRNVEDNLTDSSLFSTDGELEESTVEFSFTDTFTDVSVTDSFKTSIPTSDSPTTVLGMTDTDIGTSAATTISTTETTSMNTPDKFGTTETFTTETFTTESITTSTTAKTTKKPIKTDSATEGVEEFRTTPKDTAAKMPPTPAPVSTLSMSEDIGKRCLFVDKGLECDFEPVCYGDGEIDCTDDEELDPNENDYADQNLSSLDDSIIEGRTDETYPIRRVDPDNQKLDFFKMFPLTPANNEEEMTSTSINWISEGPGNVEISLDSEVPEESSPYLPSTEVTESMEAFADVTLIDNSSTTDESDIVTIGNDKMTPTSLSDSSMILVSLMPKEINDTFMDLDYFTLNNTTPNEDLMTNVGTTTPYVLEKVLAEDKDEEVTRMKRDKNANHSNGANRMSQASALESSKTKVKNCKLSGSLVCAPRPNKLSCSGKTLCQVQPQAIETVEKPATQKGLEKWTIAVIVVCAITATFTIALLMYLLFTSYKKLKVQPQNGVTTLNYINSTQP